MKKSLIALLLLAGIVAFFSMLPTPQAEQRKPRHTIIEGATVFDGVHWLSNTDVAFQHGLITDVGKKLNHKYPDATVVNATNKYLIPGLIDAHTHTWDDALVQAAKYGVTTEMDMFSDTRFSASERPKRNQHTIDTQQADIFSAGTLVTSPKGHGTEYGVVIETISQASEAQAFVKARLAEGSDYIKIVYDVKQRHMPSIDKQTLRAVIKATHQAGKLAVVHISDHQSALDAVHAGADGLVHSFMDDVDVRPLATMMKNKQQFIIPTLSILAAGAGQHVNAQLLDDFAKQPRLKSRELVEQLTNLSGRPPHRAAFERAKANVRALAQAGVLILAGTDAPNVGTAHGISLHGELALLVKGGLTPTQALKAATSNVAVAFNLTERGFITQGMKADFVLLDKDPTVDITHTRAISSVYKNGHLINYASRQLEQLKTNTLISSFDSDLSANLSTHWQLTTDARFSGDSIGQIKHINDAGYSSHLALSGEVGKKLSYAWSGAYLALDASYDLSDINSLALKTKGTAGRYKLLLFTQKQPMRPIDVAFDVSEQWQQANISIGHLPPETLASVNGIGIVAVQPMTKFELFIDDIWFK